MRVTLIYNARAGGAESLSREEILRVLSEFGYLLDDHLMEDSYNLDAALADPGDLVVVAGGDGTVRSVTTRLRGRQVPIAILPLGTANNVAMALGLTQSPRELLQGLATPQRRYLDLGVVHAPWGEDHFLEAVGSGLFAFSLAHHNPRGDKSFPRPHVSLLRALADYRAFDHKLVVDGKVISGEYIFAEVMNTPVVGPQLALAPGADPSDGWLEVVTLEEKERSAFQTYLEGLVGGADGVPSYPPAFSSTVTRARKVEVIWEGAPVHVDGDVYTRQSLTAASEGEQGLQDFRDGIIEISLLPGAVEIWLPSSKDS